MSATGIIKITSGMSELLDDPNRQAVGLDPAGEGSGESTPAPSAQSGPPTLDEMTKDELLAYAKEREHQPGQRGHVQGRDQGQHRGERLDGVRGRRRARRAARIPSADGDADGRDGTLLGGGGHGDRLGARLHRARPRPRIRRLRSSSESTSNGPSNTGGSPTARSGSSPSAPRSEPIVAARNTWYRHALKLAPLKNTSGIA